MCKKKDEGLRCEKHATHALKAANKRCFQLAEQSYRSPSHENSLLQSQARKEYLYLKDVRHSTATGLNTFSKLNPEYPKYEKFHNLLKNLGKNKEHSDEVEPVEVGTRGDCNGSSFIPSISGSSVVVKESKKKTVLWDEKEPTKLTVIDKLTGVNRTAYVPVKLNNKPDIQWVIWNINMNEFFPKI